MTILLIDTATIGTSVGLADVEGVLCEVVVRGDRRHLELLHPSIRYCLEACQLKLGDLSAIAVDRGPGRFTGLRVGIAAATALATALDIPLVGVESLDILLRGSGADCTPSVSVVDLRRNQLAWRIGVGATERSSDRVLPTATGSPEELARALCSAFPEATGDGAQQVLLVGDGARSGWSALESALSSGHSFAQPRASQELPALRALAEIAFEMLEESPREELSTVVPAYLRPPDAAINWESRTLIPAPEPARSESGAQ
jgi:tRNA threonylcarbamoyladenosine biosynthesis protein TsaB